MGPAWVRRHQPHPAPMAFPSGRPGARQHHDGSMALKIRLSRGGAKKQPHFRIVVADSRSPRDGRFIERVGTYHPLASKDAEDRIVLKEDRIRHWLERGARPTDRTHRFLAEAGILERQPRSNPQKAKPRKKTLERIAAAEEKAKEAAEAEKAAAEAAKAEAEAAASAEAQAEDAEAAEAASGDAATGETGTEEAKAEEKAEPAEAKPEETKAEEPTAEEGEAKDAEPEAAKAEETKAEEPAAEKPEDDKPKEDAPPEAGDAGSGEGEEKA